MKINLLYVIPTLNSGGAERQMIYLLKNIRRDRFNLYLVLFKKGTFFEKSIPDDVKVFYLLNYKNVFKTVKGIRKIIKTEKIDIVQSFLPTANFYGALSVIGNKHIKFIASSRNLYSIGEESRRYKIMNLFSFKIANIVIGNSQAVSDDVVNFFKINKKKVRTIHNGIDIEKYDFKDNYTLNKTPTILFIGRFVPYKGIKELLEITKILFKEIKVKVIFIGKGYLKEEFEKKVLNNLKKNNVKILEPVLNVNEYYIKSDVLILPTHREGFSNVIMEAMLSGLPVITTDISANRELIKNGENGFLIKVGDVKGFIDKILLLLENESIREKIGEKARETIIKNFSVQKMVSEYENLYYEISEE